MVKIRELIDLCNVSKTEHWAFNVYNLTGMESYGVENTVYSIPDAIKECKVESYTIGYNSLYIKVNPLIEAEYQSDERCLMDGYEQVIVDKEAKNLFFKPTGNGYTFAKVVGY